MNEIECWGLLSPEIFEAKLEEFTKAYGEPKIKKRLSVAFWDPTRDKNNDLQVRVTNGHCEVIMKDGKWENSNN